MARNPYIMTIRLYTMGRNPYMIYAMARNPYMMTIRPYTESWNPYMITILLYTRAKNPYIITMRHSGVARRHICWAG